MTNHREAAQPDGSGGRRLSWREVCRLKAQAAAEEEAYIEWNVKPGTAIPFNYRWEHVQQVVQTAMWLGAETGADMIVVEASAWLHDIRKIEAEHAAAGALVAGPILAATDFPPDKIETVCDAIAQHEGLTRDRSGALEPLEAAVLWDADKLTKLGVQALAYNLGTPRNRGRTLRERLTSLRGFAAAVLSDTVASMNTEPARLLAARRHAEMTAALDAWWRDAELGKEIDRG